MTEEEFEKVKIGDRLVVANVRHASDPDEAKWEGTSGTVVEIAEDHQFVRLVSLDGVHIGILWYAEEVERAEDVSGVRAVVPVHVKAHQGFSEAMLARLDAGQKEYGDSSFEKALDALCVDMEEELVDLANYAMMGWRRVRALREKLSAIGEVK